MFASVAIRVSAGGGFPAVGEDVEHFSQHSGTPTAAKSQAKPSRPSPSRASVPMETVKAEAEEDAVADQQWGRLRARRALPGAATSQTDFTSLFDNLHNTNKDFQTMDAEPVDSSDTILEKVRMWRGEVSRALDGMPDYIVRVGVAVLAFGRVRQADIFLREHALIYWIAEGQKNIRFHAGDCYMRTPSGAFQQHRGIPPDHDRVQQFLMHVEGVFRRMSSDTHRTAQELMGALSAMWVEDTQDFSIFAEHCLSACLDFKGEAPRGRRPRKGGKGEREEAEDGEDDGVLPGGPWNIVAAKTVMIVKKLLSREITEDKLLNYMSEWCETKKLPEASCCYDDCAIEYDNKHHPAQQVFRDLLENCYLRIPHCLNLGGITYKSAMCHSLNKCYMHILAPYSTGGSNPSTLWSS